MRPRTPAADAIVTGEPRKRVDEGLREELGHHLLRCMEHHGLTIEAAGVGGHPKPGRFKLGLMRSRLRPDVVARDGRRSILGIALGRAELGDAAAPDRLDSLAQKCRLLVVCVGAECADEAIETLFRKPMPHWRKMRLLTYPESKWEDVARAANRKRLSELAVKGEATSVRVIPEPGLIAGGPAAA
jgi:hypothetical protein